MSRVKKGREFRGSILAIRSVEDCIRATKKYTEGIWTKRKAHPVQGDEFPSRVFYKYYEVYPDMEVGLDMAVSDFFAWLGPDTLCIDVNFHYDYRANKASVLVKDGVEAVKKLNESIPGFGDALKVINGTGEKSRV